MTVTGLRCAPAIAFLLVLIATNPPGTLLWGSSLADDRGALIALYEAALGDNWDKNGGWKEAPLLKDGFNDDPCAPPLWFGVTCDGQPRVESLDLGGNGLVGAIPPRLGKLEFLQILILRSNQVTSPLPSEIGDLANLRELRLFNSSIPGPIPPELGNLTSLVVLDLAANQLTGPIPAALGNLANLEWLGIDRNQLSGSIPAELGNLALLQNLRARSNALDGTIPAQLGNLASLRFFWIDSTLLTGPIPPQLGNLANLELLNLSGNQLTGSLPTQLGNLVKLQNLTLNRNHFTGPIPEKLGELSNLEHLRLDANRLSGEIPPELGDLSSLERLSLSNNRLSGSIPAELSQLSKLEVLSLQNNQLSGAVPSQLGDLTNLFLLDLGGNRLSQSIPSQLGQLEDIFALRLGGNRLGGQVPAKITLLPEGVLDIRHNRIDSVAGGLDEELNLTQAGEALYNSLQHLVAVYPQLAIGGGFEIVLMVSNRSHLPWTGRAYLDGGLWPAGRPWQLDGQDRTGQSAFSVDLEPNATRRLVLSASGEAATDGWLSLRAVDNSDPEDVSAAFFYNLSGGSGLSDSTGIGPASFGNHFSFPVEQAGTPPTVLTGLAVRSVADRVNIDVRDRDGVVIEYEEGGSISEDGAFLIGDLFPVLPPDFVGSVEVSSSFPFFVTVVRVEATVASGIQLTSVPAISIR